MGFILSKFRKKKSTYEVLESLEAEITSISKFKASTVVWQKKVVGYLVTYSIVIYLLLAMLVYFKLFPAAKDKKEQLLLLIPFLVFPGLIWALRRLLTWWYHRKVRRDETKLQLLKEKKSKILDEVMEKETYKVAKQILDKFGQNQPAAATRPSLPLAGVPRQQPAGGAGQVDSQLRRRPNTSAPSSSTTAPKLSSLSTSLATISSPAGRTGAPSLGPPQGPSASSAPPPFPPSARPPPLGGLSRTAPGPPLPRPVLPRERGYLDKFVEFLVGDGPANRFALICRQCQSHNGMALREEFEYVAYRCCYCYYWNPARKQRPVAPRLPDASTAAASAASESSSGSDMSAPASAQQSRRGSVGEDPAENTESVLCNQVESITTADHAETESDLADHASMPHLANPSEAEEVGVESSDIEMISKEDVEEVKSEINRETNTIQCNETTTEKEESDKTDANNMDIDD
jgi:hypothetical protein